MLERQLELEGGLTVCRLGALCPDGGQALEGALRLADQAGGPLPLLVAGEGQMGPLHRLDQLARVAQQTAPLGDGLLLPGLQLRPLQLVDLELQAVNVEGIRLYFEGDGPRALTIRADAHYVDQGGRCLL